MSYKYKRRELVTVHTGSFSKELKKKKKRALVFAGGSKLFKYTFLKNSNAGSTANVRSAKAAATSLRSG